MGSVTPKGQHQGDHDRNGVCRIGKPANSFFYLPKWKCNVVGPGCHGFCYEDAFALLGDVLEDLGEKMKNPAER